MTAPIQRTFLRRILPALILAVLFSVPAFASDTVFDTSALKGKKLAIQTGSVYVEQYRNYFPEMEVLYFASDSECTAAVLAGKADAVTADYSVLSYIAAKQDGVTAALLGEPCDEMAYVFRKNDPESDRLRTELDAFLDRAEEDGSMEEIREGWFSGELEKQTMEDIALLPAVNGTLRVAICAEMAPVEFVKDGTYAGYEVDLLYRFCKEAGYGVTIDNMTFASVIPAVTEGKYDIGVGAFTVTEEREKSVSFSRYTMKDGPGLLVRKEDTGEEFDFSAFEGKIFATVPGTFYNETYREFLPEMELMYFDSLADVNAAVKSGKADLTVQDSSMLAYVCSMDEELSMVEVGPAEDEIAFIFPKGEGEGSLAAQLNEFIDRCREDGTAAGLYEKWFEGPEEGRTIEDITLLPAVNGTLKMAFNSSIAPYVYVKGEKYAGYEVELLYLFCKEKGYAVQIAAMNTNGVLSGIGIGKYDLGASGLTVTEERAESVDFSHATLIQGAGIMFRKEQTGDTGVTGQFVESFRRTFLTDGRYKLFVSGALTTLAITLASVLFGTLIGIFLNLCCRESGIARKITSFFRWLVGGMPEVVFLMLLFYVIFGSSEISGTVIATIGFTVIFGMTSHRLMETAENAIDPGQELAAKALGYPKLKAYFQIIFPQAVQFSLPSYMAALTTHIKATAIAGYVAVVDLTKAGDIVRGITYEAFFPLIAVAVIYFLLEGILNALVKLLTRRTDPKKRSDEQILKGVSER